MTVCEHPYPRDVVSDWIQSWRFASGRIHTDKAHYPSRYYEASISTVRCQECGAIFNVVMVWNWSRSGYSHVGDRDKQLYPALKKVLRDKYGERLDEYKVMNA